eukprot:TRINITY_DN23059_c0_g1_i1.p1 TRINITY_DN23059_c0_g1~~TRINITY_DN23059_c0_g1_i1.p1  ORF type:complete len:132 (-),score=1.15 TRINITY_DN23059_c0_g1_i1:41-436(-)
MSYGKEYAQQHSRPAGTHGHWEGTPAGSSYKGTCWCCARGCAALCITAIRGETPIQANITKYLNASADVVWAKAKLVAASKASHFPCIGQLAARSHFIILTGDGGTSYTAWDPDGGKVTKLAKSTIAQVYE